MATAIAPPTPDRLDAVLALAAFEPDPDFSDQADAFSWTEDQVADYDAAHAPAPPAALALVPRRSLRDHMQGVDLILEAIEQLDAEGLSAERRDELSEDLISALAGTKAKVDNVNAVISMFEALEDAAAKEIARLTARTARFVRQRERLVDYVTATMTASGLKQLDGNTSGLQLRANPAKVEILDTAAIPREYFRHKPAPPPEPDKTAIGRDLKKQRDVPGAKLAPASFRLVRS
jgi:hypothetical protein